MDIFHCLRSQKQLQTGSIRTFDVIFFLTDTSELSSSSPSLSAYFLSTYNIFPSQIRVVSDVFFSGGDNSSEVAGVTHHAANLTPCVRLERGKTYSFSVSPAGLSLVRHWCAQLLIWLTAPYLAQLLLVYCRHPDRLSGLECCAGSAFSARLGGFKARLSRLKDTITSSLIFAQTNILENVQSKG